MPAIRTASAGSRSPGAAGAANIKPERQREIEFGIDATALDSRANLELTVFEKRITDLLLNRTLPSSSGYSSERFNGGVLRTRGLEACAGHRAYSQRTTSRGTRGSTFARNRSLIMELPVPSFQVGGSFQRGSNIIQEGHSPTELFGNDTMPGASAGTIQIVVVSIGDQTPRYTLGMSNDVTLEESLVLRAARSAEGNVARRRHASARRAGEELAGLRRR